MGIEVYAMVVVQLPPTEEQRIDAKIERRVRREINRLDDEEDNHENHHRIRLLETQLSTLPGVQRNIKFDFCRLRLVQPPQRVGAKLVPVPKWEVLDTLLSMDERRYMQFPSSAFQFVQRVEPDQSKDAYKDIHRWEDEYGQLGWSVPDYINEWGHYLSASPNRKVRAKLNRTAGTTPFLPFRHPINDRKVQLRQIRYLFPETMTMPMAVALDYVRDRI